jgi:inhibitor of cysteine peptidase
MKAFLALVIALLVAACAPLADNTGTMGAGSGTYIDTETFTPNAELEAQAFDSEAALAAFLAQSGGTDFYYRGGVAMERSLVAAAAPTKAESADSSASGSANSYSGTNNQVASVDEADIIKTDGEYIYTVSGTTLFIITAGEEAEVVSTIELDYQPTGIFIDGDRLAVMGNFYNLSYFKQIDYKLYNGMTYLYVYDISDREEPTKLNDYKFEGNYFQARMHEGTMYLVVTSTPSSDYPMPIIMEGTVQRSVPVGDIYYFPHPYSYVQYVTIHGITMADGESTDSKTIAVEGANTLYMSEDNIYLSYTEYVNEWEIRQEITMDVLEPKLTSEDRELIEKIKRVDDDILSKAEKDSKIFQVYSMYLAYLEAEEQQDINDQIDERVKEELEQYDSLEYTIINKVSVDDGAITVGPTGQVPGHLNNQFSMDEHEGILRVATTINARWNWWGRPMPVDLVEPAVAEGAPASEDTKIAEEEARMIAPPQSSESTNNVYTLDEDLEIIDSLEGIAAGESIYSTRFIGDKLYMVTFKQVDPFFVIDLSDPADIETLGELKIPGFSRYLHPYDENTIIGIGRDATDLGRQQGLKIALFDVSNVEKPTQLASWTAEEDYSQSTAEYEHKAFLFDRERELLVIPAFSNTYDYQTGASNTEYNGAMVFRITRDDVEMRGIIDHGSSQQYWGSLVERSLYIDDLLYTKSPGLLRVNALDDLRSVQNVTLSGTNASPYPIY